MVTSLLMWEENNKNWLMFSIYHAVSWWSSSLRNGMASHLLDSCFSRPHHKNSCRCKPSLMNSKKKFPQETKWHNFACGRYHPGCCRRSQYWWKLVPSQQSINIQCLHQWKIYIKIIDAPDGKYLRVHCNAGVTYTNNIVDLHVYSNIVWYNPKEIAKIMSLRLVQKHHLGTYNIQYRN